MLAQNKPSRSVMQLEQLKNQMQLEQQSTGHTKNLYSTIPIWAPKKKSPTEQKFIAEIHIAPHGVIIQVMNNFKLEFIVLV